MAVPVLSYMRKLLPKVMLLRRRLEANPAFANISCMGHARMAAPVLSYMSRLLPKLILLRSRLETDPVTQRRNPRSLT